MRGHVWIVALALVAVVPMAAANEDLDFGATGDPCFVQAEGVVNFPTEPPVTPPITPPVPPFTEPPVPLPIGDNPLAPIVVGALNRCGVSLAGSLEVSGCNDAGCVLAGAAQAVGWSTVPGFLQVEPRVWTDAETAFGFCVAQTLGSQTITCAGDRDDITATVAPGACRDIHVETELHVLNVDVDEESVMWASVAESRLQLCRDEDGTPHLKFQQEGGAPGPGAGAALVALLGLAGLASRRRRAPPPA